MASPAPASETPNQKAARERRERRAAKMGDAERLAKISQLSGRTPEIVQEKTSPSPARGTTPPHITSHSHPDPPIVDPSSLPPMNETHDLNIQEQQEAFLRNMLRQEQSNATQEPDDPMARLMQQMMSIANPSDPNNPNAFPDRPPISGGDLAAATGLPPLLSNMLTGQSPITRTAPESPIWKVVHTIFAIAVGIYLVMAVNNSMSTYGKDKPPPPAFAQSPWVVFLTGEAILQGTRLALGQKGGSLGRLMKMLKDFVRDGALVIFILGVFGWWNGSGESIV